MPDRDSSPRRVVVWVQLFPDRPHLMLQWHDPETGKRKSKTAGTCNPLEAERARADLEYELNNGLHQGGARMSWEKFRELFEAEHVAPLRPATRRNYAAALDTFERHCSPKRLDLVTTRTVSAYAAALRSAPTCGRPGAAASTVRVRLQFLRTALRWAVEQELLAKAPRFLRVKVPDRKPQPVALEVFERLLEKAPDATMRAFLLAGWLAGLRLAEAFALEWEANEKAPWVDFERRRIWLPAEFAKGASDQWVPLAPQLAEALLALPRAGRKVFRFTCAGGRSAALNTVGWRVIELARAAGVKLSMHALRRGFGCRYAGKVPAQVLQKLMRHRNIRTTVDYYANVDAAVEEAVLGPQPDRRNSSRNSAGPAAGPAEKLSGASGGQAPPCGSE
jgi:integrase